MTAIAILAAGESARLGQPKQNLRYKGKTLLQRAIETAIESSCKPIFVVLGANAAVIKSSLNYPDINIIQNENWQEGMASSIRMAVNALSANEEVDGVLFMLCDQPFVTTALIKELLNKQRETHKDIIACTYNDTEGVPMLFTRMMFNELLLLKGQEGAKTLVGKFANDVAVVPFALGGIDIDTIEQYKELIKSDLSGQ